jgi:hypothetical protein
MRIFLVRDESSAVLPALAFSTLAFATLAFATTLGDLQRSSVGVSTRVAVDLRVAFASALAALRLALGLVVADFVAVEAVDLRALAGTLLGTPLIWLDRP